MASIYSVHDKNCIFYCCTRWVHALNLYMICKGNGMLECKCHFSDRWLFTKFLAVKVAFINKRLTTHALIKRSISNQNTVRPLAGKYRQVFYAVEGKRNYTVLKSTFKYYSLLYCCFIRLERKFNSLVSFDIHFLVVWIEFCGKFWPISDQENRAKTWYFQYKMD